MPVILSPICIASRYGCLAIVIVLSITHMPIGLQAREWQPIEARPTVLRGAERRRLDRAEQFIAGQHWDDATAILIRLLADEHETLVALDEQRYVSVAEYCHRLTAKLPPEALTRYRQLVDGTSQSWYQQGVANRDQQLLQRVVDDSFCSSWGDDALLALGELALARGDYQVARNAWLSISAKLNPSSDRLVYPDTDCTLPDIAARLVLVSIREGNWQRAERELAEFRNTYPQAQGRMAGRDIALADYLEKLLQQARQWPEVAQPNTWPTYAANAQRTNSHVGPQSIGPYELLWSKPMANSQLASFPVIAGEQIIYQDDTSVRGMSLFDGKELFTAQGDLFDTSKTRPDVMGLAQFTLTATERFVFGVTSIPLGPRRSKTEHDSNSMLWSLDLSRDGALKLQVPSDDPQVSFAGAPLEYEGTLLVPIRANDQTARAGVACYDVGSGAKLWQRWLCQANTPATGRYDEIANLLLTVDAGIVYFNTNLGAIASLRARDGHLLWLHTYKRTSVEGRAGENAYYRSPSPCVYHRGVVYTLPTDSASLFAMDATTGSELWSFPLADDYAQLIGVTDERVILFNGKLQVIEPLNGKPVGEDGLGKNYSGQAAVRVRKPHAEIFWSIDGLVHSMDGISADMHYDGIFLTEKSGANLLVTGPYLVAASMSKLSLYSYQTQANESTSKSHNPSVE